MPRGRGKKNFIFLNVELSEHFPVEILIDRSKEELNKPVKLLSVSPYIGKLEKKWSECIAKQYVRDLFNVYIVQLCKLTINIFGSKIFFYKS